MWNEHAAFVSIFRSENQHRGSAPHSESDLPEQEEEILGSDDDEQEDPNDYCKGNSVRRHQTTAHLHFLFG